MAAIALKRGGSFSSRSGSSDFGGSSTADVSTGSLGGGGFLASTNTGGAGGVGAGLYGSTLASLEYQYHEPPKRRHSLARGESQSTLGDDLSLLGECDVSSIRSDKHRPGRRASLSAAIELTKTPPPKRSTPKRSTSGTKAFGRRNSLFGNSSGKDKEAAAESLSKLSKKSGSRRASMAGYPAAAGTVEEPEPTPQFFHSRKKDKHGTRPKSRSFDKNDPRAAEITSKMRPGGKIKRPKGNRRASMGGMPGRLGLSKSNSKGSINSKGSQRSVLSSNSGGSSSYDVSDDEEYYGFSSARGGSGGGGGGGAGAAFRRTVTAPAPQKHHRRESRKQQTHHAAAVSQDLGYGDPEEYDPQLPPPPPPGANKQKVFVNRRGSTGTAVSSFPTNSAAQRSLKESLQWKATAGASLTMRSSLKSQRRGSTASSVPSVANSVDTAVVNNTTTQGGARRIPADIPPPGAHPRVPADVPPRRVPADVPPRRVPADVPPGGRRVPADVPPANQRLLSPMGDESENSHSSFNSFDHNFTDHTPLQSNCSTRGNASSGSILNSSRSSALGRMSDESDGSHGDGANSSLNMTAQRRASRGLSMLQNAAAPPKAGGLAGSSALGGGFNPYGNRSSDEEEDDDNNNNNDDDEEETEEDRLENQKMADFGSEAGDFEPAMSATDTAPTLGMTSTEASSTDMEDDKKNKNDDNNKDDDSVDSMTSEAPQEKGSGVVDVDELAISQQEVDMEEIGATGDWSQGVQEHLLHQPTTANSLLERYPGSDYGYEGADLGYGYSHLGQAKVLNAYDDESERKEDYDFDNGYGPSDLYDEDYSSFGWREHRPRTADSMEFINMEQLMSKAKNTKGLYLPTFIPAHGCTNASDFIVRCFVARLRAGMTVTKHSRSRFCKSHDRILHILPTGYHITWIPEVEDEEGEKDKKLKTKKPPTKLDLTKCLEVRHAWSRDPKSMRYTGTSTLRSKCKEGAANRSFALIYPHRTVDFTAMTVDQCKILMEGFSALCFRLQMAKLEQQSGEEDTQRSAATMSVSGMDRDDSTTASLTGTNMSAPWGL